MPLDETIGNCAGALYRGHLDHPPFAEDTFKELMLIATRGVKFSFNNQMYKILDGVAMGSLLGPALANIFVGFHETRLFNNTAKPGVYFRYVDDTFVIFGSELECDHFHVNLNQLHPNFRVEKEQHNSLNFLGRQWISHQHLQETTDHWSIDPSDFLQPKSYYIRYIYM